MRSRVGGLKHVLIFHPHEWHAAWMTPDLLNLLIGGDEKISSLVVLPGPGFFGYLYISTFWCKESIKLFGG